MKRVKDLVSIMDGTANEGCGTAGGPLSIKSCLYQIARIMKGLEDKNTGAIKDPTLFAHLRKHTERATHATELTPDRILRISEESVKTSLKEVSKVSVIPYQVLIGLCTRLTAKAVMESDWKLLQRFYFQTAVISLRLLSIVYFPLSLYLALSLSLSLRMRRVQCCML